MSMLVCFEVLILSKLFRMNTMMIRALAFFCLASTAAAWTTHSRRDAIKIAAGTVLASPAVANAIDACPPKSQNCVRATWSPPAGTSKKDAVKAVREVIQAYPQEGQNKVDGGGWDDRRRQFGFEWNGSC